MVLSSVVSHRFVQLPAPAFLTSATRPSAYYLVQCPHCYITIPWRPRLNHEVFDCRIRIHCSKCLRWFQNKSTKVKYGTNRKNTRPHPVWIGRIGAGISWRVVCTLGDRLNEWNSSYTHTRWKDDHDSGPRPITEHQGEWWPTILRCEGFSSVLLSKYPIPDKVMDKHGIQP